MTTPPDFPQSSPPVDSPNDASGNGAVSGNSADGKSLVAATATPNHQHNHLSVLPLSSRIEPQNQHTVARAPVTLITLTAITIMIVGLTINNFWIGISGHLSLC
jgi:hypothetical protein